MLKIAKLITAAVLVIAGLHTASAALQIEITGGINEGRKVAVLPFAQPDNIGVDVQAVVTQDLMRSGKFSPLANSAIPSNALVNNVLNVEAMAAKP